MSTSLSSSFSVTSTGSESDSPILSPASLEPRFQTISKPSFSWQNRNVSSTFGTRILTQSTSRNMSWAWGNPRLTVRNMRVALKRFGLPSAG